MYIGILNYFATGEGATIIIKSGKTIDEIKDGIDDYWLMGMEFFTYEEVQNDKYAVHMLQTYAKHFYEFVKQDMKVANINLHYHYNLS